MVSPVLSYSTTRTLPRDDTLSWFITPATSRACRRGRSDGVRAADEWPEQRDRRLAGWTTVISDALTDTQLTAAVQRVTRPVDGSTAACLGGGQPDRRLGHLTATSAPHPVAPRFHDPLP